MIGKLDICFPGRRIGIAIRLLYELKVKEKQSTSTITRKMHEKEEVRKLQKVEQVRSNAKLFAVTYYDLSLGF